MGQTKNTITRSGYKRLQRELEDLEARRLEAIENLENIDVDQGESEGAFYDAVVEREHIDARIQQIRNALDDALIIDDESVDKVSVGHRVTVIDEDGEEFTFDLLSSAEIITGRRGVTSESPVGRALIGQPVGATVTTETPDGPVSYTIRHIEQIPPH